MSLDDREKREIADIVLMVLDARLEQMTKEIIAGFVECVDWNNDNFAKIMVQTNDRTLDHITKQKREVIEIHTQEYREQQAKEQAERERERQYAERVGFKKAATA